MKKYYARFLYNGEEYVIRFKIKGSLKFDLKQRCFIDKDYYIRSIDDIISMAALYTSPLNCKAFQGGYLLKHQQFVEARSSGIKRWKPAVEIINWSY